MPITYQQTSDREIQDKVRLKHWVAMSELKRLNFEELSFFAENVQALGFSPLGLSGFFGVLVALFKEVARVESNLSVSIFNVVMASGEYATYASPFGMGVKFYTGFTDGTCIISANFDTPTIHDDKEKLYKLAAPHTLLSTWLDHKKWVDKLCLTGKQKVEHLSFAGYLQLAQREDRYLLRWKNSVMASGLFSTILSGLVSVSLLVAYLMAFMLPPSLAHYLYPGCWFVRNMDKPTLSQNILVLLACLTISWLLARVQKTPLIVEGAGTKFFGLTPVLGTSEHISTKWLVFLMIPILPVGTYQLIEEYPGGQPNARVTPQLLEKFDWAQIKETMWKSKFGYLFLVILTFGLGAWSFWECL